jgi:hypothetical protein
MPSRHGSHPHLTPLPNNREGGRSHRMSAENQNCVAIVSGFAESYNASRAAYARSSRSATSTGLRLTEPPLHRSRNACIVSGLRRGRTSSKTRINSLGMLQRLVRRRAHGQGILLSPCHCRGRCRIHIRRLLPESFTKSPIADYEWLILLIEHLANFVHERYE